MKKNATILAVLISCLNGFSENPDSISIDFEKLILTCLEYTDFNPAHKPETEKIQNKFKQTLIKRDRRNLANDFTQDIDTLLRLSYENSLCVYEDSPDLRRYKMRRAYCFAAIALTADYNKAYTYIEFSKLALAESIDNPDYDLLENQYLGILLIELMLLKEEKVLSKHSLTKIKTFLDSNSGNISENIVTQTRNLIGKLHSERN
ncbi:MAG: hypothetical protein ACLFTW_07830 [Chitinispirillaceae bacterium]